ncbi:hypothetical protein OROHE_019387 [Orobanche hederae]
MKILFLPSTVLRQLQQMARTRLTARKSPSCSLVLRSTRVWTFREYQRLNHHEVGDHINTMARKFVRVRQDGVTDYLAVVKLMETLPPAWSLRARTLLLNFVDFTSTSDTPVIDFVEFSAELHRMWLREDCGLDENSDSDEDEEDDHNEDDSVASTSSN